MQAAHRRAESVNIVNGVNAVNAVSAVNVLHGIAESCVSLRQEFSMQRVENYLKVLLQAFGAVTAIALVPFVMPRSWMAAIHEWLGMGVLPNKPVVEYWARTTSALYGFLDGLYLVRRQ